MAAETVLVVGGGGREHALAWALARSPRVGSVVVAPGNAGTAREPGCRNAAVTATDLDGLVELARELDAAMVVVGPEDPLVAGLVDRLTAAGIRGFGPTAAAARLEGSKAHCKQFLIDHGIPTAPAAVFTDAAAAHAHLQQLPAVPVVKASGLAAGKGVIVPESREEAAAAIDEMLVERRFGAAGAEVLLEERLSGPEVSILAFCDGTDFVVMPPAQDHKRLLDGDRGPNTGGMGAFHPSPIIDADLLDRIERLVLAPTLRGLAEEGRPYHGVLYAGLMLTADGPSVIEFNCRFGDPETQVVVPLLDPDTDLLDVFDACVDGALATTPVHWRHAAAVTVVMASAGYPRTSSPAAPISGLDSVPPGCTVFHAGTTDVDGVVHASGGRVLAVTAVDDDLAVAAQLAHRGVDAITFAGAQHRTDIARATARAGAGGRP